MGLNWQPKLLGLPGRAYRSDSLVGHLARGATWMFGFSVAAMLLGFGTQFLLATTLGDQEYGIYSYVLGVMNLVIVVTKFDFDLSGIKFVSTYSAARDWGLLRGFQQTASRTTNGLSVFIAGTTALGIWWFGPRLNEALVWPGIVVCGSLPLATMAEVNSGNLLGRKRSAQSQLHLALRPALVLIALVIAIGVVDYPLNATSALVIGFAAMAITAAVTSGFVHRASGEQRRHPPEHRYREWFSTSLGLMPSSLAQLTLGTTMDVVIVGTLVGASLAGVYSIAALLLAPAGFVVLSLGTIASPVIADLFANQRLEELRKLMILVARINIAFTFPAVLGLYVLGPALLAWIGPAYAQGYAVLVILGIGFLSATIGGHAALMLTMTGHQLRASTIIGLSAILNLVLAVLLAPIFGLVGVATATMIATVVRNIALTLAAQECTGVSLMPI